MSAEKKSEKTSKFLKNVYMHYRDDSETPERGPHLIEDISIDLFRVKIRSEEKDHFMIQLQAVVDKFKFTG